MPGSGDSIQALKAGVMEIPDVIVVNKADHRVADTMVREVRAVLALGPERSWEVPVVRTEAANGEGSPSCSRRSTSTAPHRGGGGTLDERRARNLRNEVLGIAASRLRRTSRPAPRRDPEWAALLERSSARDRPGDRGARAARAGDG